MADCFITRRGYVNSGGDKPSATVEKSTVSFTANITATSKYTVEYKTLYDTAPAFELYINDELKGTYSTVTNNAVVIDLADLALSISKAKVVIKSTSYYVGISRVYSDGFMSMTADTITTDDGDITASADSYRSGCNPYYAFDGSTSTSSYWLANTKTTPTWLQIQFPTAKVLKSFVMYKAHAQYDDCVKAFTLQGSNDGSSYVDLGSYVFSEQLVEVFSKAFEVNNNTAYTTYRFYITSANNYPMINEILMFFDGDVNIINELSIVNMGDGSENNNDTPVSNVRAVIASATEYTGSDYPTVVKTFDEIKSEISTFLGVSSETVSGADCYYFNSSKKLGWGFTSGYMYIVLNGSVGQQVRFVTGGAGGFTLHYKDNNTFVFSDDRGFYIITRDESDDFMSAWHYLGEEAYVFTDDSSSAYPTTNTTIYNYGFGTGFVTTMLAPMINPDTNKVIPYLYLVPLVGGTHSTSYFIQDADNNVYKVFVYNSKQMFAVKVST